MSLPILQDVLPENNKSIAQSLVDGGIKCRQHTLLGLRFARLFEYALGICIERVCICAIAISPIEFVAIAIWRNHYLNEKQNKGVMI